MFKWQFIWKKKNIHIVIDDNSTMKDERWTTIPFYFKLPLLRWFEIFFRLASLRQFGYLRSPPLLCMIYGRSYHKSGYWNFNIRYNRPSPTTTTPSLPNSHRSPFFRLGFHTPNFLPAPLRKSERKRSRRFECVFIRVIFQFWKSIGRKRPAPLPLSPPLEARRIHGINCICRLPPLFRTIVKDQEGVGRAFESLFSTRFRNFLLRGSIRSDNLSRNLDASRLCLLQL